MKDGEAQPATDMAKVETVDLYSGGVRLAADVYRPEKATSTDPVPAVVLCHGYTGFRQLYLPEYATSLAAAGLGAIAMDYKGWGDSDGRPRRLAPYGRVQDAQAAISFIEGCDWVDPGRLALLGISFGGGTVIQVGAVDQRVKAVVSVGGVGDGERWMRSVRPPWVMRDLARRAHDHRKRVARGAADDMIPRAEALALDPRSSDIDSASREGSRFMVNEVSMEFVSETIEFKPEQVAAHVAPAALLLVTGDVDDVVPAQESLAIYAAAREPKRLAIIPGMGHHEAYLPQGRDQVLGEIIPWLTKYLV